MRCTRGPCLRSVIVALEGERRCSPRVRDGCAAASAPPRPGAALRARRHDRAPRGSHPRPWPTPGRCPARASPARPPHLCGDRPRPARRGPRAPAGTRAPPPHRTSRRHRRRQPSAVATSAATPSAGRRPSRGASPAGGAVRGGCRGTRPNDACSRYVHTDVSSRGLISQVSQSRRADHRSAHCVSSVETSCPGVPTTSQISPARAPPVTWSRSAKPVDTRSGIGCECAVQDSCSNVNMASQSHPPPTQQGPGSASRDPRSRGVKPDSQRVCSTPCVSSVRHLVRHPGSEVVDGMW